MTVRWYLQTLYCADDSADKDKDYRREWHHFDFTLGERKLSLNLTGKVAQIVKRI